MQLLKVKAGWTRWRWRRYDQSSVLEGEVVQKDCKDRRPQPRKKTKAPKSVVETTKEIKEIFQLKANLKKKFHQLKKI